jgi:predicted secreted protein
VTIDINDNGKTIKAAVGQNVELRLVSDQAETGWHEQSAMKDPAVLLKLPREFQPAPGNKDNLVGTSTFRYKAVAAGEQELTVLYLYFGLPNAVRGNADRLVQTFKLTVKVEGPAR